MVEVLVSFIVVMIMLLMFTKVISVASATLARSQSLMARDETFNANYYKIASQESRVTIDGASFSLAVDREKTDANNRPREARILLEKAKLQVFGDPDTKVMLYSFFAGDDPAAETSQP